MAITDERIKLFVGRAQECDFVQTWLNNPDAMTRIIAITGMGGIGKSTLLIRLLQLATGENAVVTWVDGRTCYRTPKGFQEALPQSYQSWSQLALPRPKLVIGIDNFEEIHVLEGWLREVFMGNMPDQGVLLIVASRSNLMRTWLADPGWQAYVDVWHLDTLSNSEVADFMLRRSVNGAEQINELVGPAAGHPLALALTVDAITRYRDEDPTRIRSLVAEALSARLIREITEEDLQPMVDVLTLVAEANQDLLQRILGRRVTVRQYHALKQLSFMRRTRLGVGLHELAQSALFDDLRVRDPGGFSNMRERTVRVLLKDLEAVPEIGRGAVVQQLLWICRDVFSPPKAYADLTMASSELRTTGFEPNDAPAVRQFVRDWQRQSLPLAVEQSLLLLDEVIEHFSSSIRVTRDGAGAPQAMFCGLPLYDQTLALIEKYHPQVVQRLLASELGITRCPQQEAIASYTVMVGVNQRQSTYSTQELVGAMARDQFSLSAGLIVLVLITHPDLKDFLRSLGFVSQPFHISCEQDTHEELFTLDMRHQHFGDWVTHLLGLSQPQVGMPDFTVNDLQDALSVLHDRPKLSQSLVALHMGLDGSKLADRLIQELESPPKAPLTSRDCEVLRLSFYPHRSSATECAQSLHVSRATYYRYLNEALTHLSQCLQHKPID